MARADNDNADNVDENDDDVQETDNDGVESDDTNEEPEEGDSDGADDKDDDDSDDDDVFDIERAKAKIRKANREAENLRKRLKGTEGPLAELAKLKEAQKTDSEKLNDRAAAAEKRAAELEDQYNRLVIKTEFGLSDSQIKRLVGSTLDELREDAEDFVSENTPKGSKKTAPSASNLKGGREPKKDGGKVDPKSIIKDIPRW